MASVIRAIGFSNSLQQLIWSTGTSQITAYVWGGGGGGGGNDSHPGGAGSGGGFARTAFTVTDGDVIQVAVGGAGGGGGGGSGGGSPVGSAGSSYTNTTIWTTLNLSSYPYIRVTNGAYCGFLNQYGVWNYTENATYFDHTVTVNFPSTGYYNFTSSCDNYATVYLDGVNILDVPYFQYTFNNLVYVTAGNHSLRINAVNTGGPGSVGLTITGGGSFGGGVGGPAGNLGFSGSGGGGGGASVVFLNGTAIAIAGGGGGGGGGGNTGSANGQNAPGAAGQTSPGTYAGQDGKNKGLPSSDDGGGGGAGGGGYAGGNGGGTPPGDQGGYAGAYGSGLGDVVINPTNRSPAGQNQPYYINSAGYGGSNTQSGSSGLVVLDMNVGGGSVKVDGDWKSVQKTYVKNAGTWQTVQATYVKDAGIWKPITGSFAPVFTTVPGYWGTDPRPYLY